MKKLIVGFAALAFVMVPQALRAQDMDEAPETVVVTVSTTHVPIGEDRGKFMEFVERVVAPQARANPNVLAFHVLQHYYGSNSSDVQIVRVYKDLAGIEAPCGDPCRTWAEANLPQEGAEGYDELRALGDLYFKYFAQHSDEIYTSRTDLSKM
ncbi:MAG: hypothetical protein Q8W46_12530 [Candidatus Palauibacterales bacterium]|jgi:hypothetical protein|nr:hypothetical protein [Candidatus Palauibacterales bacterium]